MTLAAPAIIDVRTGDKPQAVATWLGGIGVRQIRDQPMTVSRAADPTLLASLLDAQAGSANAEAMSAKILV
jgi:hypothetical protein